MPSLRWITTPDVTGNSLTRWSKPEHDFAVEDAVGGARVAELDAEGRVGPAHQVEAGEDMLADATHAAVLGQKRRVLLLAAVGDVAAAGREAAARQVRRQLRRKSRDRVEGNFRRSLVEARDRGQQRLPR